MTQFGWRGRPCTSKAPFSGRAFMYYSGESPSRVRVITSRSAQHLPNFKILRHPLYLIPFLSAVWSLSIVPGARARAGKVSWDSFWLRADVEQKLQGGNQSAEAWGKRCSAVPLIPYRDKLLISCLRRTRFVLILLNSFDPFFQFNNVLKHPTPQLDCDRFFSASRFKGVRK